MYDIPTAVALETGVWRIRRDGDFRMALDVMCALTDKELEPNERVTAALLIFYDGMEGIGSLQKLGNVEEAAAKMTAFLNMGGNDTEKPKARALKLIDWKQDEALICSAVNKVAGCEIRLLEYLHWWTFLGYYMAIGESPLSTIVGIRNKVFRGRKLDKAEQRFRMEHPEYFRWKEEEEEADRLFEEMWNKGK